MDKQEQYKKMINNWLNGQLKGIYSSFTERNNPYVLTKKGISEEFIANTIIDFILSNEEKIKISDDSVDFLNFIFDETNTLSILVKNPATIDKVVKVMNKYKNYLHSKTYLKILYNSGLNIDFYERTKNIMYTNVSPTMLAFLLEEINKDGWDRDYVKKFMFYFLDDSTQAAFYKETLKFYFIYMGKVIQNYIATKTYFFDAISDRDVISLIKTVGDETIIKEIITNKDYDEYDTEGYSNFYLSLPQEYRKFLFRVEKSFFNWQVQKMRESHSDLYDIINNWGEFPFDEEYLIKFFHYHPDFINEFKDELQEDDLVRLKFGINGIPSEIKNQITLPTTEEVILDGDEIENAIYSHDESPAIWVTYYIDDTLWEHTSDWDYDNVEIDFDIINESNLNLIKEYLRGQGVEVDDIDRDELEDLIKEDNKLEIKLRYATRESHRISEEYELVKDIENLLKELFPNGWERAHGGIKTVISLDDFSSNEINDALNECSEWNVKCIWKQVMSEKSNRDKPSLPSYRYGIQGDYGIIEKYFNLTLADELSEL
jgi:hypothetical protein